ncbi:BTAD domain-containing putative transcriptional regulator [Marimonas sp. MJW-29]|uniref:BTAD domain-containing putative transcriptional regulator n=1 Tax=Sulfitobacter sediminis TaxID=3234186 RepID=A0ABV3RIP8_9RHOB
MVFGYRGRQRAKGRDLVRQTADFRLMGEPRLFSLEGKALGLPTAKTLATLAIILAAGSTGVTRQSIGEMLWSRSEEQQARTNLRQALSALRKALGPLANSLHQQGDVLSFRRDGIMLDLDLIETPGNPLGDDYLHRLMDAGDFMQGFALREPPFEEWLGEQRARVTRLLQERLDEICEALLHAEEFAKAERVSRKLIALDNFNEAAHRARMKALTGCGEVATALKHFEDFKHLLASELGVSPGAKTLELVRTFRTIDPPVQKTETQAQTAPVRPMAEQQVETPNARQPELRNVVVVAVDISEDGAGPSDLTAQFDAIQDVSEALSRLVLDFQGTELSNNGTSLLAVFGYPKAHSKEGERGIGFGSRAREEILAQMPNVNVRVAIVSGIVLAQTSERGNVLGDPIRRAQAQIHNTPDGRISVDRGIFQATGDIAAYEELTGSAWCLATRAGDTSARRSQFVGRDRELRQVLELLEDVEHDSRGEVMVLRGEAGIGKTRLSVEIAAHAEDLGFDVSACRVLDFGQGRKDNSLAMIARALDAPEPSQLNRIEHAVWTDLIRPEALTSEDSKLILELDAGSLLSEQTRMLQRLARDKVQVRPFLLIVEDVHWAHPNLMQSLADLAASIVDLPMVLAFTTRPENDPMTNAWRVRAGKTKTTTIDLRALRRKAALDLARNLRSLDEALLEQCLQRADGNPLFIEQLVFWAEEQSETNLPLSVQSVVQERLDKLPEATRDMARAASVLGQVFSADALEAVHGRDISLANQLDEAHLVVRREDTFSFVHALVRDGIYASLSAKSKQELHTRAAEFFSDTDPVLSARHFLWSGAEGAWEICRDTAAREQRAGRLETAYELACLAMDACDVAGERPRLLVLLGEIQRDREMFPDAIETLGAVDTSDEELLLRALVGAAECHFRLDNQDEAERLLNESRSLPLAEQDATWRTTMACLQSGVEFSRGNSQAAIHYAKMAGDASVRLEDQRLRARVLSTLADAEWVDGLFQSAAGHFRECVDLCYSNGLRRYGLNNQSIMGMLRFYDAQLSDAHRIMSETIAEARSINFARAQMNSEHMLVYIQSARAEYEAAREHWQRARHLIETSSANRFFMNSGCYAAQFMGPLGEIGPLMDYLRQSERVAEDLGLVWVLPWALASRARWTEDHSEATRVLDQAEKLVFSGLTTYPFEFYYVGIDAAIRLEDWGRVETYADRLDAFLSKEPVGLATFVTAKARAMAAAGQGRGDPDELRRLVARAGELELFEAQAMLTRALNAPNPGA